jgi:hypothetical protein
MVPTAESTPSAHSSTSVSSHQNPATPTQQQTKGGITQEMKIELGVGIGVGVGLGLPTLAVTAWGVWMQRTRRRRSKSQARQDNGAGSESATSFKRISLYVREQAQES